MNIKLRYIPVLTIMVLVVSACGGGAVPATPTSIAVNAQPAQTTVPSTDTPPPPTATTTNTPVPPTPTPQPTSTATATGTSTATPTTTNTPAPTATPVQPTATLAPPTATRVPATSTPRPTNTPIPLPTPKYQVPPGKAGILLQNYIDGKLSFTIQDHEYVVPASPGPSIPGELFILVDPGKATYSANLPNGAHTDGEVTTQPDHLYNFPFRYR